jgi:hypothetical protein
MDVTLHGWIQGGAHPSSVAKSALFPAESALLQNSAIFNVCPLFLEMPKKGTRSLHQDCTKPNFL